MIPAWFLVLQFLARIAAAQSISERDVVDGGPRSLYEAHLIPEKQFSVNDLILVIVEESGSATNNSNTNLRRKFDLKAELEESVTFDPENFTLRAADPTSLPSVDLQSEKRLEGRGFTDRRERISFRITARVMEILPNGNLLIEGRTTRLINDEESILTLFGEVNPEDISLKARSVRSERVADLKLVFSGRGPVSRNLGRSFFTWLLEWVWPF